MTGRWLAAWASFFASAMVVPALPELLPGRETSVPWAALKHPLVVRLPDNYTAERPWPVVFHFHGTGGSPTIDIPLRYTGGSDFILVGMEYATRDLPAATPDYLEQEWANLVGVRDALARAVSLDPRRVYVGGFSQGGWFASEFAEVHMSDLAGAYVLGAGKRPRSKRTPKSMTLPKPVYLGAGQLDINYIYAVAGINHFSRLGGRVTFDDFLGVAHSVPMDRFALVPSLAQWFRVEALVRTPEKLREEAAAWADRSLETITTDSNPARAWVALSRLRRSPFFTWLGDSATRAIDGRIAALEKSPELRDELAARTQYFGIIERELAPPVDGDYWRFFRGIALRYDACWKKFPQTYHGRRAAMELARLRDQLGRFELWRFPDPEARQKAISEAATQPLPEVPVEELRAAFRRLQNEIGKL